MACERILACSSPDSSSPAKSKRLPNTCSRRSTKAAMKAPMSATATSWRTRLGGIGKAYVPWRSAPIDHGATMFSMKEAGADGVGNAETGNMLLDEILAFEMRDARLLVGIGNGRIDQMPDAGSLRSFRGNDSLTGLFLGPGLVAVAHQKHGADATCCLQNRRCVTEIASHELSA